MLDNYLLATVLLKLYLIRLLHERLFVTLSCFS